MYHRKIKITDKTLDVVFSRFMYFPFTITMRQKPKGVMLGLRRTGSLCVETTKQRESLFYVRFAANETFREKIGKFPLVFFVKFRIFSRK